MTARLREDVTDGLRAGLVIVALLSAFAGAVDACGLSMLKDLFVSFMSGNTTSLGIAIGHGDPMRVRLVLSIIALFVAGSAAGTMLALALGRHHLAGVVAATAPVLAVPVLAPSSGYLAMTFAMGALNAAMDHAGPVNVSVTYITGTLVKLGRGLGLWLCRRERDFGWLEQAVPWVGLLVGAAVAAACLAAYGRATIAALPVVALCLAAAFWFAAPRVTSVHRA